MNNTKLSCFKSYDIRGKIGTELNECIAKRIGQSFAYLFQPKTIVVGGDSRLTSDSIKNAFVQGLLESGVNVIDIGLSGTEEIYFATAFLCIDGGVEITASHNPIDYNGMKIVRYGARPLSGDTELRELQALVESDFSFSNTVNSLGVYKKANYKGDYVKHLLSFISIEKIKPLKLVINSGNGAAGPVIDLLEKYFDMSSVPVEIIKINHNPDGNFPNGVPNPLLPECRKDTIDAVIKYGADIGIAFDGDFDRCFFFDEKGEFIEGYYVVGLLAASFIQKKENETIIHDPRLYWNTIDVVQSLGASPIQSKTGHVYIKEKMRELDAIYGGEMSAHHYFRDFFYCDSGMIPWLLVIELISIKNAQISSLVSEFIRRYPSSGEINIHLNDVGSVIKKVSDFYLPNSLSSDFSDGISIEFDCWRFNLRASNTEPVVRLNVESRGDIELMKSKTEEILRILKE